MTISASNLLLGGLVTNHNHGARWARALSQTVERGER
jgi:hypothetical protein